MTKKKALAACAERLYIIEQMTINEIANELNVHEKSIRNWKEDGDWEKKREQFLDSKKMFHVDLYNFARKLMVSIEFDMENNIKPDPGRMFAFTKMLPLINKIKEYEDEVAQSKNDEPKSKEISPDFVRLIQEEFLGMKPDDK